MENTYNHMHLVCVIKPTKGSSIDLNLLFRRKRGPYLILCVPNGDDHGH